MTSLPVVFERSPHGLVVVTGPDATSFLQAIVSQDLEPVAVGDTVPSLLLHPQGKLDVIFRAHRRDDSWWLDTEGEQGPHLAASLTRYRIRVDVAIEDRTAQTGMASVVGIREVHGDPAPETAVVPVEWGPTTGVDVVMPIESTRRWIDGSGLRLGTEEEFESLRIEAGVPRLGVDVDDSTIPQEAFLERAAVSFTKGCFLGQELVCRIDSRGHVNRFLRRLALSGDAVPPVGSEVVLDGKVVGSITSAAPVPGEDRVVALGMLRREVEPPADAEVRWDDASLHASVLD